VVKEVVCSLCKNPISAELEDITADALESYDQFEAADSKSKAIGKLRSELLRLFAKTQELTAKASDNPVTIKSIEECTAKLDELNSKSCQITGFTYVNLAELATLK